MQYHDQLHPWVVYRRLPNCQNIAIARFRRRNEAEMYQIAVRRLMPKALFLIAFDPSSVNVEHQQDEEDESLNTAIAPPSVAPPSAFDR